MDETKNAVLNAGYLIQQYSCINDLLKEALNVSTGFKNVID